MRDTYESSIGAGAVDIPTPDEVDQARDRANEVRIFAAVATIVRHMKAGATSCELSPDEYDVRDALTRRFAERGWVLVFGWDQRDGGPYVQWRRAT